MIKRTGSLELYIPTEPLMSQSALVSDSLARYLQGLKGSTTFLMIRQPKLWPMKTMGLSWHFEHFQRDPDTHGTKKHTLADSRMVRSLWIKFVL